MPVASLTTPMKQTKYGSKRGPISSKPTMNEVDQLGASKLEENKSTVSGKAGGQSGGVWRGLDRIIGGVGALLPSGVGPIAVEG